MEYAASGGGTDVDIAAWDTVQVVVAYGWWVPWLLVLGQLRSGLQDLRSDLPPVWLVATLLLLAGAARFGGIYTMPTGEECVNLLPRAMGSLITDGETSVNPPLPRMVYGAATWLSPLLLPRLVALMCSLATVVLVASVTWRMSSQSWLAALLAGVWLALDPHQIEQGVQVRSYPIATMWTLTHILAMDRLLQSPTSSGRATTMLTACLMAWTHYLLAGVLLIEGLLLFRRLDIRTWLSVFGTAAAVTLPLALVSLANPAGHFVAGRGLEPVMGIVSFGLADSPLDHVLPHGTPEAAIVIVGFALVRILPVAGVLAAAHRDTALTVLRVAFALLLTMTALSFLQALRVRAAVVLYVPLVAPLLAVTLAQGPRKQRVFSTLLVAMFLVPPLFSQASRIKLHRETLTARAEVTTSILTEHSDRPVIVHPPTATCRVMSLAGTPHPAGPPHRQRQEWTAIGGRPVRAATTFEPAELGVWFLFKPPPPHDCAVLHADAELAVLDCP